jgi:hypothetical protein
MGIWENATAWGARGFSVLPVQRRGKLPDWNALRMVGSVDANGDPMWTPYKHRLPRADELKAWFANGWRNYGIITGGRDLVVLDFDDATQYVTWWEWAAPALRQTYTVATNRGVHVYLLVHEAVKPRTLRRWVEVKAAGYYVLGPGSLHPTGHVYVPVDAGAPICEAATLADVLPPTWYAEYLGLDHAHPQPLGAVAVSYPEDPWAAAEAARLPVPLGCGPDPLHRIKERFTVADVLPGGVSLTQMGWGIAFCPIPTHGGGGGDHRRSLQVDLVVGHYTYGYARCFGGCHANRWMDVINLWAEMRQISDREAVRELATRL